MQAVRSLTMALDHHTSPSMWENFDVLTDLVRSVVQDHRFLRDVLLKTSSSEHASGLFKC